MTPRTLSPSARKKLLAEIAARAEELRAGKVLRAEQNKAFCAAYRAGIGCREIANAAGIANDQAVRDVIRRAGL